MSLNFMLALIIQIKWVLSIILINCFIISCCLLWFITIENYQLKNLSTEEALNLTNSISKHLIFYGIHHKNHRGPRNQISIPLIEAFIVVRNNILGGNLRSDGGDNLLNTSIAALLCWSRSEKMFFRMTV